MTAVAILILLVPAMIPSIVAALVDRTQSRLPSFTVSALNFAGTFPFCVRVWSDPSPFSAATAFVTTPWVWMVIYLAAGAGWVIQLGALPITVIAMEALLRRRGSRLVSRQRALRAEWGDAVTRSPEPKSRTT